MYYYFTILSKCLNLENVWKNVSALHIIRFSTILVNTVESRKHRNVYYNILKKNDNLKILRVGQKIISQSHLDICVV